MKKFLTRWLIILVTLIELSTAAPEIVPSTDDYLKEADKIRLIKVLEPGFKLTDIPSVHQAVVGYKYLGKAIPNPSDICSYVVKTSANTELSIEDIYYLVSTWKSLGSCQPLQAAKLTKVLTEALEKDTSSILDLYHATLAYVGLLEKLSDTLASKIAKTVQATLRKDDSLTNLGYTFHIASHLNKAGSFALDKIKDTARQADEVDGRQLQFEGGLSVTSLVVTGIAQLSTSQNTLPPVSSEQIVKLANYLLSRKSVQTSRGVVKLLSALQMLAHNEFSQPICITIAKHGNVVSTKHPLVSVKVCDVLGNPLLMTPVVIANSANKRDDDTLILSKQKFKPSASDKTLFTLNFMDDKPSRGFYNIHVSAGVVTNTLTLKVLSEVKVDYLEIGTGDADQTTQPKLLKVAYPNELAHRIEADSQQKLVMRFSLSDSTLDKPIRVHQAFVRLSAVTKSDEYRQSREVIFVAEPDASNIYKFDMPVGADAQTFGFQSGDYNLDLIVGDPTISNSFQWPIAVVRLKFSEPTGTDAATADKSAGFKQKPDIYSPKPEITHMFREPEKRPPVFVSNLFTGLCLAPILLLLILWIKLQVNIAKFPLSLSAIVFHLGLAGIFVLFGLLWLKLDMFVTLRNLLGLGIVTFLAGSNLLSHIAHNHKASR